MKIKIAVMAIVAATIVAGGWCIRAAAQTPPPVAEANRLIGERKFGEAASILEEFVKSTPQAPMAWFLLGSARSSMKEWEKALEAYDQAAKFPQVRPQSLYNKACVYSLMNKKDNAIETLKAAIAAGFIDRDLFASDTDWDNIRGDERFAGLIPPIFLNADAFVEPTQVIHAWDGEAARDQFGWVCSKAGDIDGDKVMDVAITAPTFAGGKGKVYVYSGKSGKIIFTKIGPNGSALGNGVGEIGDTNGDKIPDLGVTGTGNKGVAQILSGKTGELLIQVEGSDATEQFGNKICGIGDIDGDGSADFIVTSLQGPNGKGACTGFSGKDGSRLFTLEGEEASDLFGSSAAGWSDGKRKLLAVGAHNAGEADRGKVYLYDLSTGNPQLKGSLTGDAECRNLGQMFLSFPGDFNQDGVADFFASDFNHGPQATGKVWIASGNDGKVILEITGKEAGENLGTSISDGDDINKDGIPELIVGAWQNSRGATSGGRVYLYDGATGEELRTWTCRQAGDTLGFDATGVGDLNGDGTPDFMVTSAWSNIKGVRTGRVFVVSGAPQSSSSGDR